MNAPTADLPVVDLDEEESDAALERGLFETGFFLLRDHVIPREILDAVRSSTLGFMARPAPEKEPYRGSLRGWTPYGIESAAAGYGEDSDEIDRCQKYSMGRMPTEDEKERDPDYYCDPMAGLYFEENVFPEAEMEACWQAYYDRMDGLCLRLIERVRGCLGLSEEAWQSIASHPVSVLRFLYYPEEPPGHFAKDGPDRIRMGAHYDDTLLTVLHQSVPDNGFAALQVRLHGETEWQSVAPSDDVFVVNIGEALTYLSGGRVVATEHRVVAPPDRAAAGSARTSLVHFFMPNWNARLWPSSERATEARITRFDRPELREPDGSVIYYKALQTTFEHTGITVHTGGDESEEPDT